MTAAQAARIAHEVNRAYCESVGDHSQLPWDEAPDWQRTSAQNGIHLHWTALGDGRTLPPSASHESWLAEKLADGWKYGPVKDPARKEHPCCIPYNELPEQQKAKDYLFGAVAVSTFIVAGEVA